MNILLIGTGLIGGSFSLALQEKSLLTEAGGYSRNPQNLQRSLELGLIQQSFETLNEGIAWADWIVLSIPVDAIISMLPGILDQLRPHQYVVDFGSTKGHICHHVQHHPKRSQFIAAHPIAGTEYSGPDAAFADLFKNKIMIVCDRELSNHEAVSTFISLCTQIGMKLEFMSSGSHDKHLAYISHLSHVTSFALSNVVLEKEKDGDIIIELAGSGFESTVRLAKSSPEMWAPIFMDNKKEVIEAIGHYLQQLNRFKEALEGDDEQALMSFLNRGREIRKIIK